LSKVDSEFPNLEASLAEVRRLREENARLRSFLIEHSVRIPDSVYNCSFSDPSDHKRSARRSQVRIGYGGTADRTVSQPLPWT